MSSQWVGSNRVFKSIDGDRIFALLVEGARAPPSRYLPTNGNPLEPLAADPRDEGDGKRLAKLKLISGLLGVNLDQLTRREQARQNQPGIYRALPRPSLSAALAVSYRATNRRQRSSERETPWKMPPTWSSLPRTSVNRSIGEPARGTRNSSTISSAVAENLDRTHAIPCTSATATGMVQLVRHGRRSVIDQTARMTHLIALPDRFTLLEGNPRHKARASTWVMVIFMLATRTRTGALACRTTL